MRISFTSLTEIASGSWEAARQLLSDDLLRLQSTINKTWEVAHHADGTQIGLTNGLALGIISGTLAEQPTGLTSDEDGLLYFVTDYGHLVRWDAVTSSWKFAPGDNGAGYFQDFAIAPQATGWVLADGSATNFLTVGGATLTTTNITLPDLNTLGVYRRGGGYTGALAAAIAAGITLPGATGSNGAHTHTVSGSTAAEAAHTHTFTTGNETFNNPVTGGGAFTVPQSPHQHTGTTAAGSSHSHTAGSLAADSNGAHTHTIGAGSSDTAARPPSLGINPYFRR